MARSRGIDPYEFTNEGEVTDVRYVNILADASDVALETGVADSEEEIIDTLYSMGYSPEFVDAILRTRELNEGSWN